MENARDTNGVRYFAELDCWAKWFTKRLARISSRQVK